MKVQYPSAVQNFRLHSKGRCVVVEEKIKSSKDYTLRESIIEHLFVGQVLKALWAKERFDVEVLKPQVDNAGYDLVIGFNSGSKRDCPTIRHIQLKSSNADGKRDSVNVSLKLAEKPNWCVIWIFVDGKLDFESFLWFDSKICGCPFKDADFKKTKHSKGDSTGTKAERPGLREVPKTRFKKLSSLGDVIDRLFEEAPE
jgi:hypothetical protein